jgi:hypothetical protein
MAPATQPTRAPRPAGSSPATRLAATLILIPAVPLLVASLAALALHYAAPERFGAWISRLPGDEVIRIALAFSPATLFAIVVLAVLYARDTGAVAPARAAPVAVPRPSDARRAAAAVLAVVGALLVLSIAALGLSFVSPERFEEIIGPLPGTPLLRSGVRMAPLVLAVIAVPALYLVAMPRGAQEGRREQPWRFARISVGMVLIPTVPMLAASLLGLALLVFSPDRILGWLERLAGGGVVRLALVLAPVSLLAVVLLASLYLSAGPRPRAAPQLTPETRGRLGVLVLAGGLVLTALAALGVLGAAVLALLR